MRWLIVVLLVLVSACSAPGTGSNTEPGHNSVGYDVTRDSAVPGLYHASGAYLPGSNVKPDTVKWRALLNGVEVARKEGYDLAVWSGPKPWTLTQTTIFRGMNLSAERKASIPGFAFVIQGYKSGGAHPPSAYPVATLIAEIESEIARAKR